MSKIVAGITTSVDGYITGPDDGPGCGRSDQRIDGAQPGKAAEIPVRRP
jgi:hypothetical protein